MRKGSDIEEELTKIAKVVKSAKPEKNSQQKAIEKVRKTWSFNPKTRVKPSDKGYKRNKSKDIPNE